MPGVELRHAIGVQNVVSSTASATLAATASVARTFARGVERGSRQSLVAKAIETTDARATRPVMMVAITRSVTLSNNGPPGRNSARQTKAVNAKSAIARLSGGAPESAAIAISTKNADAVATR